MSDYWENKNVLVTGAGGFIASHLVEALHARAAKVRAFVRYNSRGDPGLLAQLPQTLFEDIEVYAGDLRDASAVRAAMEGIDLIFHLGALIAIPYSYVHPREVVETNVIGTLNVLMAGRELGIERLMHTSTSEVYGTARYVPMDEAHPLQGQSPYSASKIAADKLAESFYRSYDLPVVTMRPFNTYGPRQSARAVIPTIITQALTQPAISLGNLDARRDLTYVEDTVNGFMLAAETPRIEGRTFNLGSGSDISIGELAEMITGIIGERKEIHIDPSRMRPEKSEVQRLLSDHSRASEALQWQPQVSLTEGLTRTIHWIQSHLDLYRPSIYQL
jgi:dTDP-glucose 4,6-dehydratase